MKNVKYKPYWKREVKVSYTEKMIGIWYRSNTCMRISYSIWVRSCVLFAVFKNARGTEISLLQERKKFHDLGILSPENTNSQTYELLPTALFTLALSLITASTIWDWMPRIVDSTWINSLATSSPLVLLVRNSKRTRRCWTVDSATNCKTIAKTSPCRLVPSNTTETNFPSISFFILALSSP